MSAVADNYPKFQELGVEVLSVSVDSVYVHKMWNDNELSKMVEGGIPFPMLSDAGGKVGTLYNVYDSDAGVENRGRFIIDPDGIIQGYEVLTPPVGRNVSETVRQFKRINWFVNPRAPRQLLPAGNRKNRFKSQPDLVGNVWKVWSVKEEAKKFFIKNSLKQKLKLFFYMYSVV